MKKKVGPEASRQKPCELGAAWSEKAPTRAPIQPEAADVDLLPSPRCSMGYPSLTIATVAHRLSSSDGCFLVGGHKRPRSRPTPGTYAPPPKAPKKKRHTHTGGWRPPIRSEEAQARRDHQRTLRRRKYFRDNRKRWQDQLDKDVYGKKASWAGRRSEGASGSLVAPKRRDQITAGRRLHQEAALPLVEGALVRGMNGKTVRASAQTSKEYIGCVGWEEVDETICNLVAGCTRPWGHAGLCALPANATRPARRSAQNRGHAPSASGSPYSCSEERSSISSVRRAAAGFALKWSPGTRATRARGQTTRAPPPPRRAA